MIHLLFKKESQLTESDKAVTTFLLVIFWGAIALSIVAESIWPLGVCAGTWIGFPVVVAGWYGLRGIGKWRPKPPPKVIVPEPLPPPPPPPTREEVGRAARDRYQNTLHLLASSGLDAIELEAGRARAKQTYLREIDGLM